MKFINLFNKGTHIIKTQGNKTLFSSVLFTGLALSAINTAGAYEDQQAIAKLNVAKAALALSGYNCRNTVSGGLSTSRTNFLFNGLLSLMFNNRLL